MSLASMDYDAILLIMWFIVCGCAMISGWVWISIAEIKGDEKRLHRLEAHVYESVKLVNQRLDGIEKKLIKDGYRPPHKK